MSDFAELLAQRVDEFLDGLAEERAEKARFPFPADDMRRDWAYFPRDHKGLPLHAMDFGQAKSAHAILSSCLSLPSYAKACAIMSLESVLSLMEGNTRSTIRDPGRYFFSVFGSPGTDPWAFQVEGHHVCLNFTVANGEVIGMTPLFLGANPAEVRHGDYAVSRPCGEEQDAGFDLLAALNPEQREKAVLTANAPVDFVLVNAPQIPQRALPGEVGAFIPIQQSLRSMPAEDAEALAYDVSLPKGLPAREMNDGQRDLLERLVRVYLERVPGPTSSDEIARVTLGTLHFAWAGSQRPGDGHYYRVQGGPLLIEYDNTQDGANHVHAVWRDAERDFGGDALRAHLATEHSPK
jgi:hypothetical protein